MSIKKILRLLLSVFLVFSVTIPVHYAHAESATPVGYVTMSVEANTLGAGFIREPIKVPFYDGENYAKVTDRFLNGLSNYQSGGTLDSMFYLSKLKLNSQLNINVPQIILTVMNKSNQDIINAGSNLPGFLGEFDYSSMSGWMYAVNHDFPNVGAADKTPSNGDVCRWQFTLNGYGADLGQDNSIWGGSPALYTAANKDLLIKMVAEINSAPNKAEILAKPNVLTTYQNAYNALTNLNIDQASIDSALSALSNALNAPPPSSDVDISTQLKASLGILLSTVPTPSFGTGAGEWSILTLARGGYTVPETYYTNYYNRIVNTVKSANGVLSTTKNTEYSRLVLALSAIGKGSADVGGYNMLTPLADFDKTTSQGINGGIFALIALDTNDYEIPINADSTKQATRQKYVDFILNKEVKKGTSDAGGFALFGTTPDPDITSMALQALAPYQSMPEVRDAVKRAVDTLSRIQQTNGGFTAFGSTSSESIAQVIVALTSVGVNPATDSRFVKSGGNLVTALLRFYVDGGGFKHILTGSRDGMATDQGTYALVAYDRFVKGASSLYKMNDVPVTLVTKQIVALPTTITLQNEGAVVAARTAYNGLAIAQKGLIVSTVLDKLVTAENKINSLKNQGLITESVVNQINELPITITLTNEVAVVAARTGYNGLTEDQKKLIVSSVLDKLIAAENKIAKLINASKSVKEKIEALPSVASIRLTSEATIKAARLTYDSLDSNQKALVGSITELTTAEARLAAIKSDKVAPTVSGVINNGLYKVNKTIKFIDNVGILSIKYTFNGKPYTFSAGKVISSTGKHSLLVTDLNGNKRNIIFFIDKKAPLKPTVKPVTNNSTKITGKAEAFGSVYIYKDSKRIGFSKVLSNGTYTVKISKQKKGTKIKVYEVDRAGNKSGTTVVTIK